MRCHHLSRRGTRLTRAPRWRLPEPPDLAAAQALAAELSLPVPLASLLVQRGFHHADTTRGFLRPDLDTLADPLTLAGMADAVTLIVAAVKRGTPILVHGDYDVDGQCATALLTRALRVAHANVTPFVPHRLTDGYDFGAAGLAVAEEIGAGLILTCDCGITAVAAVAAARAAGREVVVTDHHLPGATLPDANAVVDPQRADDTSGLTSLCGTGLALKLVQALVEPLGLPKALPYHLLDYVAIATVADVVPLVGENRVLVKHGLKLLGETRWAGWRALLERCKLGPNPPRAAQVAFILAPRLNAVGRIGNARDGLRLLLTDDPVEAVALADRCETLNRERQEMDQRILEEALALVEREYADATAHTGLVLMGGDWHPGVIGIVASRIVERYGRPVFLLAADGDTARGSGRSIDGFDLHAALEQCGDLLERFGGHQMAAGLTVRRDRIDAFRERFNRVAQTALAASDLGPSQRVDLELGLDDVTDELERWSRHLEPCGMGNPAPVFGVRGVRLEGIRTVAGKHLKGSLASRGRRLDAIAFGWADRAPRDLEAPVDIAFRLERNEWHGTSMLQARILTLAAAGAP
ncbi:MAG TPA: single-stranded-DNA-specific exonuclease RecJ [Gemmatimonadales bacterium]|nr:single-stranded-DNA-specific exonuclease RecJ [Gemmatimonadales bacterium]